VKGFCCYVGMAAATFVLAAMLSACESNSGSRQSRAALDREIKARETRYARAETLYRGGLKERANKKPDEALEAFKEAVDTDRRHGPAWVALGITYFEGDDLFKAAEAFHAAAKLMPTAYEPRFNLAVTLEAGGKYRKAIDQYEAALRLAPDNPQVMENLALCLVRIDEDPERAESLVRSALVLETRGEWREWLKREARRLAMRDHDDTSTEIGDPKPGAESLSEPIPVETELSREVETLTEPKAPADTQPLNKEFR
jgi:tetratricopeptide (TPR) repeat protein